LMLATGNIRNYQIVVGGFQMMNFPVTYLCYKLGAPSETVFTIAICISFICEMSRLVMLKKMIGLPVGHFLKNVYFRTLIVALCSAIMPIVLKIYCEDNLLSFIILTVVSVISAAFFSYTIGCTKTDRVAINNQILKVKKRIFR